MPSSASSPLRSTRQKLCSRAHADRVAFQLCEAAATPFAVVRTADTLQPYRVMPANEAPAHLTELEVRVG